MLIAQCEVTSSDLQVYISSLVSCTYIEVISVLEKQMVSQALISEDNEIMHCDVLFESMGLT